MVDQSVTCIILVLVVDPNSNPSDVKCNRLKLLEKNVNKRKRGLGWLIKNLFKVVMVV